MADPKDFLSIAMVSSSASPEEAPQTPSKAKMNPAIKMTYLGMTPPTKSIYKTFLLASPRGHEGEVSWSPEPRYLLKRL
ncbi:MAG: hypothetical protein AUK25_11455 [Desulfobacteraceae bacterium CG2_30_51_40]|nr:MAG: hypothetical protein AUK25_11455 [Desulfobacteraceae bacterium CG2_30_51_40]